MTHEELVEKVWCKAHEQSGLSKQQAAEEIGAGDLALFKTYLSEIVGMVGEACADICTSKVPDYSTNDLIGDTAGGNHPGSVYAKSILSLTQGTKE